MTGSQLTAALLLFALATPIPAVDAEVRVPTAAALSGQPRPASESFAPREDLQTQIAPASQGAHFDGAAPQSARLEDAPRVEAPAHIATAGSARAKSATARPRSPEPPAPAGVSKNPLPSISVPATQLRFPRISLLRAREHAFKAWTGEIALRRPLTSSDHWVLSALSFVLPGMVTLIGAWLTRSGAVLTMFAFSCIAAYVAGKPHIREGRDAHAVVLVAREYLKKPTIDPDLAEKARRFEKESGWQIRWTDSPHLLAQVDPKTRTVTMSIGWIAGGDFDPKRRRLAYLTSTLHILRTAAKEAGLTTPGRR